MPSALFAHGRRLFTTASILTVLTAIAHSLGHFAPPPTDEPTLKVLAAMGEYHVPLGFGMSPSMFQIQQALSLTMGITFAAFGILGLVLAASRDVPTSTLRRVGWVNAVWVAAAGATYAYYRIPPPLISTALIELATLSWLLLPARREA
ncbi:MAG: hypothetical protein HYR85_00980 [Planctomycetes bacterium]|nr:hypothetical protein [Planctomycetota bacterium]MBI3844804.1 hypothetical protein [Planctomycetota bacterium]